MELLALVVRQAVVAVDAAPPRECTVAASAPAKLFLTRACELLAGDGDLFLSFGSRRPGVQVDAQRTMA